MWRYDSWMLLVWQEIWWLYWSIWCSVYWWWILLYIQYFADVWTIVRFCKYLNISFIYLINYLCSINGAELNVGQENLYYDSCQDWLDLINKKLTSPNYPADYDPNTICKWNLTTKEGHYISLDFEHIRVSDKVNDFKCLSVF